MPVEALLLPLRMPLFCSFEIIALVGCGIGRGLLRLILPEGQVFGDVLHLLRHGDLLNIVIANDLQSDGIAAVGAVLLIFLHDLLHELRRVYLILYR